MKKLLYVSLTLVILFGLTIGMAVPASANGEPTPPAYAEEIVLYAGQDIDVGTVYVWNDADYLHIKYKTEDGWLLKETHLQVAVAPGGIPQTKKGNPIPGKFDQGNYFDIPQDWDFFSYPIDSEVEFSIAAHAAVIKLGPLTTETITSGAETDSVLVISESSTPDLPEGYPGSYSGTTTTSVSIEGTDNRYSGWPSITGAEWIAESTAEPNNADEWRLFTRTFSLPSNATNFAGTLEIGKDNAFEVKLNNVTVGSDGEMYEPQADNGEWNYTLSYSAAGGNFHPETNTLEIMVRNYYWDDMPEGLRNYTGLIYKFDYEYQLLYEESAWAAGADFPGANWATYFEYEVQETQCDLVGVWLLQAVVGDSGPPYYNHDMFITTQNMDGTFSGTGGYPAGESYSIEWTVEGTLRNGNVDMMISYPSGYWAHDVGTISADCDSMGGSWTDLNGKSGTWTATRGP